MSSGTALFYQERVFFHYRVEASDKDTNGISIGANALRMDGGSIRDVSGNQIPTDLSAFTITDDPAHKVDGAIEFFPGINRVSLYSSPRQGDTYRRGEQIEVRIEFKDRVRLNWPRGGPPPLELTLQIGSVARRAAGVTSFRYEVQASDYDPDGISIPRNALRHVAGTIRDDHGRDITDLTLGKHAITNAPAHKVDGGGTTPPMPPTLDLTCHGYDEGATRAYNCIPEPSQQHHMQTFVPPVGSACDGGRIAEFPPGRIVFQIRCRDGQTAAWSYWGQAPASFVLPVDTPRVWVRTAFPGSSALFVVRCRVPQQSLVVNELLGTAWGNDGTNGIYGMAGCREVEVDTRGADVQWWFTPELAATALTPSRSWEHVTGAGSALPAAALQDLAAAAELEELWGGRRGRGRMHPRRGASIRGALLASDADGGPRRDLLQIASTPDDHAYALDGPPFRGATRTVPLTLDLTCHGYDEGATRAYNCIPEPSQQHHMQTFVPPVGSTCDGGRIAEFPPGRIVFQIRCRDGQTAAWSYWGQAPASFVLPVDTPRVWVRTAFPGSSALFVVRCRVPQQSLVVNELLGTSWGNDGTNALYQPVVKVRRQGSTWPIPCTTLVRMAMGTPRDDGSQPAMWVATADLPRGAGHPFFERLNQILGAAGFDAFVETLCAPFYATMGRPSLAPGRYFRLLLLGYFEGLDSERADRLAGGRFAESAGLSAPGAAGGPARPFDDLADAPAVERGDAPGGLHLGAAAARRRRAGAGQDGGHRRDDAGSQCGLAQHRAPRHGRGLHGVPGATGGSVGHRDADPRRVGAVRPVPQAEEDLERRLDPSA